MKGNIRPLANIVLQMLIACLALLYLGGQEECTPPCPEGPAEGLEEGGGLVPMSASGFQLEDTGKGAQYASIIDELARVLPTVSASKLASDLNREGTRIDASALPRVDDFHVGFRWNDGDFDVSYWIPQGITGSGGAFDDGLFGGRKFLLVSWHYDASLGGTSYDKGVRVSFVDVTDMDAVAYRHVLLVEPVASGGRADFRAVPIHAGGIVWYGDYLYVADTYEGLRVFDVTRIMQVATGDKSLIGYHAADGQYYAHDYKYILPQVGAWYLAPGSCESKFSFAALDRSTTPHSIVTGEYDSDRIDGLLVRWPLDEATAALQTGSSGLVTAMAAYQGGHTRMQGVLSWEGQYWISSSSQDGAYGRLYRTAPGAPSVAYDWVDGPEDLHLAPSSGNLWTPTEDAGDRYVFAVKLTDYGG